MGLYIFPAKNQTAEQQQKDESYCYEWAIKNSGIDPLNREEIKPDSERRQLDGKGSGCWWGKRVQLQALPLAPLQVMQAKVLL